MAERGCDALLARDIVVNCNEPITKGVERKGVIINFDDIKQGAVSFDEVDGVHVIKTMPLNTGKKGFRIIQPAKSPFAGTNTAMVTGTYGNTFTHQVGFVILDSGPDVAAAVDALANGKFVVILENTHKQMKAAKAGISAFQVYGFEQGLVANAITSEKWSDDARSGWAVTLEEAQAPTSAIYLYNTSYDTTKAQVESYLTAATE